MSEQAMEVFGSVEQTLTAVEEHLATFKQKHLEEFVAPLSPLETAKVQISLAYTINALLFVFLKTQGVSSKDIRQTHVRQELERVKSFINRIKDAEELAKGPKLALDKGTAKRFIHSALSTDQVYADAVKTMKEGEDNMEAQSQAQGKGKRTAAKSFGKKSKRHRKQ